MKVGSRSSPLALAQVEEVFALLARKKIRPAYDVIKFSVRGDKDKTRSLTDRQVPDNFFTDTLDAALLNGEIDVAVHSAKDLPRVLPAGLAVLALTAALDETDAFVGKCRIAQLPAGARIGTSSLIRQQGIKKLNPGWEIVDIRGTITERIRMFKDGKCDGVVVATCALKRLGLEKEIKDIFPWEPMPLQGQLAVVGRVKDKERQKIFSAIDVRRKYGFVALAGAGPGDPELITVKAIRALQNADCVFYDYLAHPDLLHYAPRAQKIYVGKRKGEHTLSQAELSKRLKEKAIAGKNVVRLKGGDPLVFGRGADEIIYLRAHHIKVAVIPGISSATGIPSSLGVPLTARGISNSVAFVSGHEEAEHLSDPRPIRVPATDTIVFLMGLTKLGMIVAALRQAGWKDEAPVMIVSKGTTAAQRIVSGTVANIEKLASETRLSPPALVIAGETIRFWEEQLASRESVLYLGTHPEKYKDCGRVVHHPMIEITYATAKSAAGRQLIRELDRADLILFTSPHAVLAVVRILQTAGIPLARLGIKNIAVIGADTADELRGHGMEPKVISAEETSEGLLKILIKNFSLQNKRVLFPRSSLANANLKQGLSKRGARVIEVPVYQNTKPAKRPLPAQKIDAVMFTSPSTVANFLKDYSRIPAEWTVLSKGPRTAQALAAAGYSSEILVRER